MHRRIIVIGILLAVALFWCGPAMALDIIAGEDAWVTSFYGHRTYDKSSPASGIVSSHGGWIVGLSVFNAAKAGEIGEVHIIGNRYIHVQTEADLYYWIDRDIYDYAVWIGHKLNLAETFEIQAFDTSGNPIYFSEDGGGTFTTSLFVTPSTTAPMPPICSINNMKVKNNGDIQLIFTAPYKNNLARRILIRVFKVEGTGADAQFVYNPPYEYLRADGSTKGDTVKATIPAEFSGREARIEYWLTEEGTGYRSRGIKYFTLP